MKIIDISPLISSQTAVWPGDVAFRQSVHLDMEKGDHFKLSSIETSLHIGAHADSPDHFTKKSSKSALDISSCELTPYLGPTQVIEVNIPRDERILVRDLPEADQTKITAPRVLFKTRSFPDPNHFNEDFNSFSVELLDFLGQKQCVLVGIDTPSVDPFHCKTFDAHHALVKNNIRNLEGIVLDHVTPGEYFLSALPLKIHNGDAAPVRAVLVQDF